MTPNESPSDHADKALLHWSEERLKGIYEPCPDCVLKKDPNAIFIVDCNTCHNSRELVREDYIKAEMALSDEQFIEQGPTTMVTARASVNKKLLLEHGSLDAIPTKGISLNARREWTTKYYGRLGDDESGGSG